MYKKKLFFILNFILITSFTPLTTYAQAQKELSFSIKNNGEINIDGLNFNSTFNYVNSDYFRATGKRCGTKTLSTFDYNIPNDDKIDCSKKKTIIREHYWPAIQLTIPVVVHIIHKSDGTGNIGNERIKRQLQVLNEDFSAQEGTLGAAGYNTQIKFELVTITRTPNDEWFNDRDEKGYKSELGWDQEHYCNIYVNSASGYLGYSYFPQDNPGIYDGIVCMYEAFGGRGEGISPYDQGRTLVHEMGHYFGLYHTFEGEACMNSYETGDLITDTPAENSVHYECVQTSTCLSEDPIHNYMNYTPDICMNQFSKEQSNRMICSLLNYRPELAVVNDSKSINPVLMLILQK